MELEEGIYVRTKQGYIAKFKEYDEIFDVLRFETPIFLRSWVPCDYMQKERFMNRYFLKASHNIIDLIEVGDYVNGEKVIRVIPQDICGDEVLDYQHIFVNDKEVFKEEIKSILTKEMFENMKYEVK